MRNFNIESADSWCDRLESDVADLLRPELSAVGVGSMYVIAESALGRDLHGFWGSFGPALSLLYQPHLADRWRGPAPAILLADRIIRSAFTRAENAAAALIAVAAHELGHVVQASPMFYRDTMARSAIQQEARNCIESTTPEEVALPTGEFPYEGHTPVWARITIHAAYRLQQRGWPVRFDSAWCPTRTKLWGAGTLHGALAIELPALANVPLRDLDLIPPPAYFTELISICARSAISP